VTHVALSSTRVMATCALLGQALGTAAALALRYGCTPEGVLDHIHELQQNLLDDGVFLPHVRRRVSAQTLRAVGQLPETLFNGVERPRSEDGENSITQSVGENLCFRFASPEKLGSLRLRFDPDFSRQSISINKKMRVFAMKLHTGKDFQPVHTAATIVKSFAVYADGREIFSTENNFLSLVKIPLNCTASEIRVEWRATHGADCVRLYAADFVDA